VHWTHQTASISPISWRSQLQTIVSLSSTEAEYIALAACVQEVLYLKYMLVELTMPQRHPIVIHEDNQSTIKLVKNPEGHGRTKLIDIKHFFVQEAQDRGDIILQYCATQEQAADILTQALPKPQFVKLRDKLGVTNGLSGHPNRPVS
jgi:hypothetical protein